jgi:hypothetical protein
MNFLSKLLSGIAFIPSIVHGIEALSGSKSGADKKSAAMSFASAALSVTEAVSSKEIADDAKFRDGLRKIIDGVQECINASTWAKSTNSAVK